MAMSESESIPPSAEPSPAVRLEYAPAPNRKKKLLRRAVAVCLIIAIAAAGWWWGPGLWQLAPILYWQRQCMNYQPGPEQVIYEEEPTAAAKLLAADPRFHPFSISRGMDTPRPSPINAAAYFPRSFEKLESSVPGPPFRLFGKAGAMAFLHERISPAGHRRLVFVTYCPEQTTFTINLIQGYNCEAQAIQPGTITHPPAVLAKGWVIDVISTYPQTRPNLRMYAGQIDPNDASHFTIRYEIWGQTDILDGRLDDQDNIMLTPRKLPEWR